MAWRRGRRPRRQYIGKKGQKGKGGMRSRLRASLARERGLEAHIGGELHSTDSTESGIAMYRLSTDIRRQYSDSDGIRCPYDVFLQTISKAVSFAPGDDCPRSP